MVTIAKGSAHPLSLHFNCAGMQDVQLIVATIDCVFKANDAVALIQKIRNCENQPHIDLLALTDDEMDPHPLISEVFELVYRQVHKVTCDA